jgi:hypothetical protein
MSSLSLPITSGGSFVSYSRRPIIEDGGPLWTVPELLFESKKLIPALQQLVTGE